MYVPEIYFQENYQVGEFLYRVYGAKVCLENGDTTDAAYDHAQKIIRDRFIKDNPQIKWSDGFVVTTAKEEIVAPELDAETNIKFQELKDRLFEFEFKEDAEAYLLTTDFKYNIDAKKIINNKPSKEK